MKPELPFAPLFAFPWAKHGGTQLRLCLETSLSFMESFACPGTQCYLRGQNPGWDVSAGEAVGRDKRCGERSWDKGCAHLRQPIYTWVIYTSPYVGPET